MRLTILTILLLANGSLHGLAQESYVLDPKIVFATEGMLSACDSIAKGDHLNLLSRVKFGFDINERGKSGCTLLLWCWCNGYHHAFEALLEMGADPHAVVDSNIRIIVDGNPIKLATGESVAWVTIRHSRIRAQFVEKLTRYLRNANQRDSSGGTLLHALLAAADDKPILRPRIVKELNPSDSPYNIIASMDRLKLVDSTLFAILFYSGVKVDARDNNELSAIEKYIKWIQSVNASTDRVKSALSIVIGLIAITDYFDDARNRSKIIVELDSLAGDPQLTSLCTDLATIVKSHDDYPREYLRSHNSRDHFSDFSRFLVMDMYSEILSEEVFRAITGFPGSHSFKTVRSFETLRGVGFNPNVRGESGFTHLFAAYLVDKEAEFETLLKIGADPDLRLDDDLWFSAPDVIRSTSNAVFCPERGDTVLLAAAVNPKRAAFVHIGLQFTKATNIRDSLNRNMLHRLLYHRLADDQQQLIEELVKKGIDVDAQSIGGATPSHEAVYRNALVIPHLVRFGAKTDIRDLQGRTVLDLLRLSVTQKWTFHEESEQALALLER